MICSRCGATMSDDQIFCLECGHEIIYVPLYNVEEDFLNISDLFSNDLGEMPDNSEKAKADIAKDNKNKKTKSGKIKAIIIVAAIVLLLILGILAYSIITSNSFDYQYNKAVTALDNEDYRHAYDYANKAVELENDNSKALVALFKSQLGNKDYDAAYNTIIRLTDMDSSDAMAELIIKDLIRFEDYNHLGHLLSNIRDEQLLLKYQQYNIPVPKLNYSGGNYSREIKLKITVDSDADIYFTLDGSDPLKGNLYKGEISLNTGKYDLRAVAVNAYKVAGLEKTASFDISPKAPDMPIISTSDKIIKKTTRIILECQKGCTMYYTWDGTTPTTNSTEYKGPIEIPVGNNIISVIAVDDYGQMSSIAKKNYILNENVEE